MDSKRKHLNLNGSWLLVLDPEDRGRKEGWHTGEGHPEGVTVQVPSVWDRWAPDYNGAGWCFRTFSVDESWLDGYVTVEFEGADYYAEVWLNGNPLGAHEGGYTPFSLPAGESLRPGENLLAVRLIDPHGPRGFDDFRTETIPCAREDEHFHFAGLWGAVGLTQRPHEHIAGIFVQPDLRRERLAAQVDVTGGARLRLTAGDAGYSAEGSPGRLVLDMPGCAPWSPESPVLHTLRAELLDGAGDVLDAVDARFGMREFTVKDNRFHLNGRPLHVKAILHELEYPRALAAPETEALAREELRLMKEAGFNMVRFHARPAPPVILDIADELGLLIYAEPAIGRIAPSPHMESRCLREAEEMIRRDRNHPSIVVWGMLSESGNAGRRPGKGAQTIKDALCARVRELDPTRLIIDDFGGAPITREPARFMPPFSTELQPFDDAEIPREGPALGGGDAVARSCGAPGKLAFPAAQGFGGLEDLDGVVRQYGGDVDGLKDGRALKALRDALTAEFNERGLDRTFGSLRYLAESAQALAREAAERRIDALRGNPRLHGYCLGQLSGAGLDVCAGLLDRWRRSKPALEGVKAAQAPVRLALDLPRVNLAPREEAYVQATSINETGSEDRYDLSLQVVGPTNQVLWKKKRSVKLAKGARALWDGAIAASGSLGPHRFVVRLMLGIKIVTEASVTFYVYERPEATQHDVHVVDPLGQYRGRCQGFAKVTKSDAAVFVVPPLANTIRAYPDEAMGQVLSQVEDGAVALVFGPPGDWNDLAAGIAPDQLNATSRAVGGPFSGAYHYVRLHPVFETLPSRCLMGASYASVAPVKTFIEPSDEDIAGALDLSRPDGERWGQDILVRPFGSGHVVFTHLRVLENLETDPLAQRLFVNLINHFGRWAVPAGGALPTVTQVRNWIRQTRAHELRRWMVVGLFPNANGEGHETVYPPEESIDFGAEYDGWRKSIRWRSWFSRTQDGHAVDLSQVFTPATDDYPWTETGAAYAYAEFQADRRVQAKMELAATDSVKLWMNGHPLIDEDFHAPMGQMEKHTADAMLRQGRNTVLVKISKLPGESRFTLDIAAAGRDPLNVIWWR